MEPVRLHDLAEELGAELVGDGEVMITGVAGMDHAGVGDITFLARATLMKQLASSPAAAVIIGPDLECDRPALRVKDPYQAFVRLLERIAPSLDRIFPPGIHPTAVVDETAELGDGVSLGAYVVVGAGCRIGSRSRLGAHVVLECDATVGDDCILNSHAVVGERCQVGNRAILHSTCVLGADGFGFLPGPAGLTKIPQVGYVILEDDVELGAGTCVDRATTGVTVIGQGTKLDNMIQVGHNVRIGRHSVFSAQTGISGSVEIGDGVFMGGQVGIKDHLKVGNKAQIGAQSGLHKDVPDGTAWFGSPALEAGEAMRIITSMTRLPGLVRKVRDLEKAMNGLVPKDGAGGDSST